MKVTKDATVLQSKKTQLAAKFISDNASLFNHELGWKRTCARMLYERYPDLFTNVESARNTVRWLTGNMVSGLKKEGKKNKLVIEDEYLATEQEAWQSPFVMPSGLKDMAVMNDIHGNYYDKSAFHAGLSALRGVKTLLINGDLYDFESLTRHVKKEGTMALSHERDFVQANILDPILKQFDKVYLKSGNHETWFERYLANKAPELQGAFNLDMLAGITKNRMSHIHDLQEINYGDLDIIHGHEFPTSFTPKMVAKGYVERWQAYKGKMQIKLLLAHHHQYDFYPHRNIDGTWAKVWVAPCLRQLKASYQPFNRWTHGVMYLENKNKNITVNHIEL